MTIRTVIACLVIVLANHATGFSSIERPEFEEQLSSAITKLNREARLDGESLSRMAGLLQRQYGTNIEELQWAVNQPVSWGEIVLFAYIQATTGRSFEQIIREDAQKDFWSYAEASGMNCDKMASSLSSFLKQTERERNSRILERLRVSRRVQRLPDLGNGFGLVQEALDFRRIESPGPVKVHNDSGLRGKSVDGSAGK
jgi:hypothetical protein